MSILVSAGLPTGMEGLTYPIPFSDPSSLLRIAQHAEKLGYHSVWGNDHMSTQNYVRAEFSQPPRFWEILTTYAWLAAQTTTLRFGTGILVLPMRRDIVVTAKQIATLDHLSGGRLEIGVGIGAYREEFEALWPNSRAHRGDMVEEGVEALHTLFSGKDASFDGGGRHAFPRPLLRRQRRERASGPDAGLRRRGYPEDPLMAASIGVSYEGGHPPQTLRDIVQVADELGAGTLWAASHLFLREP